MRYWRWRKEAGRELHIKGNAGADLATITSPRHWWLRLPLQGKHWASGWLQHCANQQCCLLSKQDFHMPPWRLSQTPAPSHPPATISAWLLWLPGLSSSFPSTSAVFLPWNCHWGSLGLHTSRARLSLLAAFVIIPEGRIPGPALRAAS